MKWFVFMFVAIAATLMVTPEANSGSFDPVTGAYTTDPITVTLTPRTVTACASVIANGERVYWAANNYAQRGGPFYWGPHTHTMSSSAIATTAATKINATGVCSASASGTSLTISGCFSFMEPYMIYMGKSASCKSFYSVQSNVSYLTSFGEFVGLTFNLGSSQRVYTLNKSAISSVNTTSVTYPRQTVGPFQVSSSPYDADLKATLTAKTPPYVYFNCSVPQGASMTLSTAGVVAQAFEMVTTVNKPAYAPTISYSPALPITNTIAVNIRNIAAMEILPSTVFNTGTISAWRTIYMEQPLTVTGQGNITRNFGASQNFNVLESWSCAATGQIDFRIMRDNTNANVCSGATYTHPVQTPQSLTAQWKAQSSNASGTWSARATVTFTLP